MKLSTRVDIEAPIEYVFSVLTDFASLERQAMRRGIEVTRTGLAQARGAAWDVVLDYRGKTRALSARVVEFETPELLLVRSESSGVQMMLSLELLTLSRSHTRMVLGLDMRPQTLPARILLQSVKFGKSKLTRKLSTRVDSWGKDIENRFCAGQTQLS
jgi:uncharacterized protein YndB with AHSA1/START domain